MATGSWKAGAGAAAAGKCHHPVPSNEWKGNLGNLAFVSALHPRPSPHPPILYMVLQWWFCKHPFIFSISACFQCSMFNAIKMLNAQCYLHLYSSRLVEIQRMKDYLFKKHDLLWCNETILPLVTSKVKSTFNLTLWNSHLTLYSLFFSRHKSSTRQQETGRMGRLTEYNWYNW